MRKLSSLNLNVSLQDPASVARLIVAVLVLLNLVAAYFVLRPPGGSPDDLAAAANIATSDLHTKKTTLDRTRLLMTKIKDGRDQGDTFLSKYFLPAGRAYSTVYAELIDLANGAKITPRESSYSMEPV